MGLMTPFDVDIGTAIDGETGNGTDVDGSLWISLIALLMTLVLLI